MNRRNATRNALFTSVVSLLLCVTMLLGTTFAWFTDSVTSANNIIQSGNLDVEMYWADGTKAVPADENGWTDASKGAIFNYNLWEPGYTEVRHIKIANKGSLALKYQLVIKANGTVSDLADVIDVYYTDPAAQVTNRTDLVASNKIGTLNNVLTAVPETASGSLEAGKDVTVTIALKMQEEAGNAYMNKAIGSDFSVVLMATQYTSEDDSFDTQYDALAAYPGTGKGQLQPNASALNIPVYNEESEKVGSVVVPAGAVKDPTLPVEASYDESDYKGNFTVATGMETIVVDVKVSNLKEGNTAPVKAYLYLPMGLDPATVKLYHYDTEIHCDYDPNTGYVIFESATFSPFTVVYDAESEYVPPVADESKLPKATVERSTEHEDVDLPWESYGQWSPTAGLDAKLEAAFTFTCPVDAEETLESNPYAHWYCDFYVSLDKDLGANQLFLGGNYGDFGWVGFHNGDLTLDANTEIGLLESVTSSPWTYANVVNYVGEFLCGVGDVNNALDGATFTVKLRLTNPENTSEYYDVNTVTYTFGGSCVIK